MSILLNDLIKHIESKLPKEGAEEWDNVGFLVGDKKETINKVLVCLDVTNNIIEEAIEKNVNLILSHHPIIYSKLKTVTADDIGAKKIFKLIKNNIAVYSAHTNFDLYNNLTSYNLAKKIGFDFKDSLTIKDETNKLGVYGDAEGKSFKDIITAVKENLNLEAVKYVGNENDKVKKIALVAGSGMDFLDEVMSKDIDLFITGDIKYHAAVTALENNVKLIDAGHFESEIISLEDLSKLIDNIDVEVIISEKDTNPFRYK